MLLLLSIALPLAVLFYVPALLLAALVRPLAGIKADDQERVERLRKYCLWGWGALVCLYALIDSASEGGAGGFIGWLCMEAWPILALVGIVLLPLVIEVVRDIRQGHPVRAAQHITAPDALNDHSHPIAAWWGQRLSIIGFVSIGVFLMTVFAVLMVDGWEPPWSTLLGILFGGSLAVGMIALILAVPFVAVAQHSRQPQQPGDQTRHTGEPPGCRGEPGGTAETEPGAYTESSQDRHCIGGTPCA